MNKRCKTCGVIIADAQTKCQRCEESSYQTTRKLSFRALFYIFDGLTLLFKNKKLVKLSIFPLVITTILLVLTYTGAIYFLISGIENYLPSGETGGLGTTISRYGLTFVGSIALLIVSLFIFLPLASIVCIPFNDLISLETEKVIIGKDSINENQNALEEIKVGIKEVAKLLILKVIVVLISLPIFIIPIVGQPLFLFILAMLTSIDFLDVIMARKKYSLSEKLAFVKKNSFSFVMFSLPLVLLFWIPIVQIMLIPCAVIGGTKFFLESEKKS